MLNNCREQKRKGVMAARGSGNRRAKSQLEAHVPRQVVRVSSQKRANLRLEGQLTRTKRASRTQINNAQRSWTTVLSSCQKALPSDASREPSSASSRQSNVKVPGAGSDRNTQHTSSLFLLLPKRLWLAMEITKDPWPRSSKSGFSRRLTCALKT